MNVHDIVKTLPYPELVRLLQDLKTGAGQLTFLVEQRIKDLETASRKACASCGTGFSGEAPYTLVFGPESFRKKASFCGMDCLEDFQRDLREMSTKRLTEQ